MHSYLSIKLLIFNHIFTALLDFNYLPMKNSIYILFFLLLLSACVKEAVEKCPTQYSSVRVLVQDKNHSNDSTPISEDLPFKAYVGNLCYTLYNAETYEPVKVAPTFGINSEEKEVTIPFEGVPEGRYLLTLWGNMPSNAGIATHDAPTALHEGSGEQGDVYLASNTLEITSEQKHIFVSMKRTKGKVEIICNNFPDSIAKIEVNILRVFGKVDKDFTYSTETSVTKTFPLSSASNLLEMFSAPTFYGDNGKSEIDLTLFTASNKIVLSTSAAISIRRNELCILRASYDALHDAKIIIEQLIDGQWEGMGNLSIVD